MASSSFWVYLVLKMKTNVSFVIITIWAVAVIIEKDNEEHLTGSWTDFNRQVTKETNVSKCFLQYLPTIPRPLEYSVCKKFFNELLKVMRDLDDIFVHSDEHVYAWLAHIIWKDLELYRNIDILMGRFHESHARQKTIYEQNARRRYQKWVIDAKTVAPGSSDAAVEGWDWNKNDCLFSTRCLNSFSNGIYSKTEEFWTAFADWKGNDEVLFSFRPYQLFTIFNVSVRVFESLINRA